jgi:glutathione S-transferase
MAKKDFEVIDADGHLSDTDEGIAPYLAERYRKRRRPFYPRDNFDRQMSASRQRCRELACSHGR